MALFSSVRHISLTILLLCVIASAASAATLTVTNTGDAGVGSLRATIAAAASGDTIVFGIPANSTIALTSGAITFPAGVSLTIDASSVNTVTIQAAANNRVFLMPNDGARNIDLRNLVITGGSLSASGATGAGIAFLSGGSLSLTGCTVSGNSLTGSNSSGAGIYMANAGGTLTITRSTISGNSLTSPNGQGAGLWTGVNASLSNTTVSGNTSNSNNSLGGGIYVNNSVGNFSVNHVTVTDNSSVGNGSNGGGGIFHPAFVTGTIRNSIFAGNTTSGTGPDMSGTFTSGGYNLVGNGTGATGFTNGVLADQVGTAVSPIAPLLLALAANGGPTQTHALSPLSPARDKGSASGGLTVDQRNVARPYDDPGIANAAGGNGSDIGAFEAQTLAATGASIAGRVTTADGRGIGRVMVVLTGGSLAGPQYAVTSPFGYFRFDEAESGMTYIVTVASKQYAFAQASRVVTLADESADIDFVADPLP